MNAETPGSQDKFRRYRAAKKAAGLKEYRIWARDWDSPEFRAEMDRAEAYFAQLDGNNWVAEFGNQCLADFADALDREENKTSD